MSKHRYASHTDPKHTALYDRRDDLVGHCVKTAGWGKISDRGIVLGRDGNQYDVLWFDAGRTSRATRRWPRRIEFRLNNVPGDSLVVMPRCRNIELQAAALWVRDHARKDCLDEYLVAIDKAMSK